ncbi:MAG: NUDIX domain-containing protein [Pseudohongiellaceae bacterium]
MNNLKDKFSAQDVEIVERQSSYRGFLKIDKLLLKHKLVLGGWSKVMPREVLLKESAVAVLLFDPKRQEVVLVRQFRVGMLGEPQNPWLVELVAGMIEKGESPEDVARRESEEEADCSPKQLKEICNYYSSPGTTSERVYLFCGQVDSGDAGGVFGLDSEHEDIEVVVMPVLEFHQAVESGQINNAMTIIASYWLEKHGKSLSQEWLGGDS